MGGIIITSLSGLNQTPFVRIQEVLDVAHMGAPLTWMTRVIPSDLAFIDWVNFATDWFFWLIIVIAVITVSTYLRHRQVRRHRGLFGVSAWMD